MSKKDDLRPYPYEEHDPEYPHYQYRRKGLGVITWSMIGVLVALITLFFIGAVL